MEGLYLYCIRERIEGGPIISMRGVDGRGEAYALPFNDLEAVVSKVSFEEFGSEEIQRKAREDLEWIKEKAIGHARIVEGAMRANGRLLNLMPMRFGAIFKSEEKLRERLGESYSEIKGILKGIRGGQEWGVKAYLIDRKKIERMIEERSETIRGKEREMASLPEGMAFFMEEELREVISREVEEELNGMKEGLFERLKRQAVASIKCKFLGKELTGREEPMILNAAFLIPEENMENFKKEIARLNQQIGQDGFLLECSGPWPPYNFTSMDTFRSRTT